MKTLKNNARIVPVVRNLPIVVLGTGMLSVVLAGFVGSKLPTLPTGAGVQETELLEDLGLLEDEMTVSEVTSLPTAELVVAADEIAGAGQLFEPALLGGPDDDGSQLAMGVSVPGGIASLGPRNKKRQGSKRAALPPMSNAAIRC